MAVSLALATSCSPSNSLTHIMGFWVHTCIAGFAVSALVTVLLVIPEDMLWGDSSSAVSLNKCLPGSAGTVAWSPGSGKSLLVAQAII